MDHAVENHVLKTIDNGLNRGLWSFRHLEILYNRNNSMLLLTSYEVHMGKYSDRNFEVRTERSKVRTKS